MRKFLKILYFFIAFIILSVIYKITLAPSNLSNKVDHELTSQLDNASIDKLLELFAKKKDETIIKLKSASKNQAISYYERYIEENEIFLSRINDLESELLSRVYTGPNILNNDIISEAKVLINTLEKYDLTILDIGEGSGEITTRHDFYYSVFKGYVTNEFEDYLFLKSEESKFAYSGDSALLISLEALADRIIACEKFINKYPESEILEEIIENYNNYQIDYLMGVGDNSESINWDSHQNPYIYAKNVQEFDRFMTKYPESPTTKIILFFIDQFNSHKDKKDLLEILQKKIYK